MTTICPICKKDDAIQKVTAVVSSGQATGTFSGPSGGIAHVAGKWGVVGGYSTLRGETMSTLSQFLSPLQERPKPWLSGCCSKLLLVVSLLSLPFLALVLSDYDATPQKTAEFIAIVLFVGGGYFFLSCFLKRSYQKELVNWADQESQRKKETDVWERLYYCFRDDIVFDPKTGESCQPEELEQFLHSKVVVPT
ncbi:MAG: hypothetical protein WBD86_03705 [Microgenomates group bacterium]